MIERINKACRYFPCHKGLEDCTFCYCPFYPCQDKALGERIYSLKLKKYVWSCLNCSWIHRKKTVGRIFSLIRKYRQELRKDTPLLLAPLETIVQQKKTKMPLTGLARRQGLKNKHAGIIILGHGSRLKKANALIPDVIKTVKRKLGLSNVVSAYLQLAQPDLSRSIKVLADKGCKKIIIVPFFLFVGNHVSRDIPEIIAQEKTKYPRVNFVYTKNLGQDARIQEIAADKITEGINGCNE